MEPESAFLRIDITEHTYSFPSEMILDDDLFHSYVKHCILESQHRGYYVISAETLQLDLPELSKLIFKVGKLPKPDLQQIGIKE